MISIVLMGATYNGILTVDYRIFTLQNWTFGEHSSSLWSSTWSHSQQTNNGLGWIMRIPFISEKVTHMDRNIKHSIIWATIFSRKPVIFFWFTINGATNINLDSSSMDLHQRGKPYFQVVSGSLVTIALLIYQPATNTFWITICVLAINSWGLMIKTGENNNPLRFSQENYHSAVG